MARKEIGRIGQGQRSNTMSTRGRKDGGISALNLVRSSFRTMLRLRHNYSWCLSYASYAQVKLTNNDNVFENANRLQACLTPSLVSEEPDN